MLLRANSKQTWTINISSQRWLNCLVTTLDSGMDFSRSLCILDGRQRHGLLLQRVKYGAYHLFLFWRWEVPSDSVPGDLLSILSVWFLSLQWAVQISLGRYHWKYTDVLLWYHMLSFDYVWFWNNSLCDMNEVFVCWRSLSTFLLCLSLCQSTKLSNLAAGNQPNEYLSIVPPGGSFNYF